MKKLLIALTIISSLNAGVPSDKLQHLFVGGVIYYGCLIVGNISDKNGYYTGLDIRTCLVPVVLIGAGKEIYDYKHPENHSAEWGDFAADMAIPLASFTLFEYKFQKRR